MNTKIKLPKKYNSFSSDFYDSEEHSNYINEVNPGVKYEEVVRRYACQYQIQVDAFFNQKIADAIAERFLSN